MKYLPLSSCKIINVSLSAASQPFPDLRSLIVYEANCTALYKSGTQAFLGHFQLASALLVRPSMARKQEMDVGTSTNLP